MIRLKPEQTVAHQVPDTRHHAAAVLIVRDAAAAPHEREDEGERDQERRAVDDEQRCSSDPGDQRAGDRRPDHDREVLRAAEEPGRLRDRFLVVTENLREDRALDAEYGAMKMPSRKTITSSART